MILDDRAPMFGNCLGDTEVLLLLAWSPILYYIHGSSSSSGSFSEGHLRPRQASSPAFEGENSNVLFPGLLGTWQNPFYCGCPVMRSAFCTGRVARFRHRHRNFLPNPNFTPSLSVIYAAVDDDYRQLVEDVKCNTSICVRQSCFAWLSSNSASSPCCQAST